MCALHPNILKCATDGLFPVNCQDWFFTDLISTRGQGVRGWPSSKTEMLHSIVTLPE